jgi:hypothetical protein
MANDWLQNGLTSRNGFVRKGARALLAMPKWLRSRSVTEELLAARPPALANSFPKSGTHLLAQILEGLPGRENYGAFLGSQTSSFQLRERSTENTLSFIRGFVPGEIIRGHLFYESQYADELVKRRAVNYFIYRDPRDVVVSEAHYLRSMNRWHKLHPYFRDARSIKDAILLSINGLQPPVLGIDFPNIADRFARYEGWLADENCMAIRYEELISERQQGLIRQAAEFFAQRSSQPVDVEACAAAMSAHIAPHKSHTFRSGKKAGWAKEFTPALRERFAEVAGELLIRLGYESNLDWARMPAESSA